MEEYLTRVMKTRCYARLAHLLSYWEFVGFTQYTLIYYTL